MYLLKLGIKKISDESDIPGTRSMYFNGAKMRSRIENSNTFFEVFYIDLVLFAKRRGLCRYFNFGQTSMYLLVINLGTIHGGVN